MDVRAKNISAYNRHLIIAFVIVVIIITIFYINPDISASTGHDNPAGSFTAPATVSLYLSASGILPTNKVAIADSSGRTIQPSEAMEPNYDGYIVELKNDPLIRKLAKAVQEGKTAAQIRLEILAQKDRLSANQLETLRQIRNYLQQNGISLNQVKQYFKTFNGISIKQLKPQHVQFIKSLPLVKNVYPNIKVHATLMDSIPMINADDVWKLKDSRGQYVTGKGIKIAIIDTGVDYTHPDLGGCLGINCKVIGGYDFVNHDNDPMDDQGHGTHVAATAAGNGVLKGVAPDAKIVALKVLNSGGSGTEDDIIEAIEAAIDPNNDNDFSDHYDVISMSLGGYGDPDDPMSTAIDNVVENGVIAVIAAGNSGPSGYTIGSPGTSRRAITVGAIDKSSKLADFSSRGPTSIGTIKPDVVAPGVLICAAQYDSAFARGDNENCNNDANHVAIDGTSMATPHVSGVAALVKQMHPDWTPDEIKFALRSTSSDLGFGLIEQGYGKIDALAAVQLPNPPPIGTINTSGTFSGIINITGYISGKSFRSYRLFLGKADNINSKKSDINWTQIIASSQIPVNNVLGTTDTRNLDEGEYFLKLEVTGSDYRITEDITIIKIDNVVITAPSNYKEFDKLTNSITIRGNAEIKNFDNYIISYQKLYSKDSKDIVKSSRPKSNGVLGIWNVTGLNGYYILELKVYPYDGDTHTDQKIIYIERSVHDGWPQSIEGGYTPNLLMSIDKGGLPKILVTTRLATEDMHPALLVFNTNGVKEKTFMLPVSYTALKPSSDDLNHDMEKEILFRYAWQTMDEGFLILKNNGSYIESRINKYNGTGMGPLYTSTIADMNNDNYPEIIIGSSIGKMFAIESKKMTLLPGFPFTADNPEIPPNFWSDGKTDRPYIMDQAVGDIDNDGKLEIVFGIFGSPKIYTVNHDGTPVQGFPVRLNDTFGMTRPTIGDINNDGKLEIIVAGTDNMYILNSNGQIIKKWAVALSYGFSSPSLGDINLDGYPEIIIPRSGYIYVYNQNGNLLPGWPKFSGYIDYFIEVLIADISGDKNMEVISFVNQIVSWGTKFDREKHPFGVMAWHHNGTPVDGFPKQLLEEDCIVNYGSPIIGDIDKDGLLEIAAVSNELLSCDMQRYGPAIIKVWDLDMPYSKEKLQWSMYGHDLQNTGRYTIPGGQQGGPVLSSLSANPSTVPVGQIVTFAGTGSSPGRTVKLACGLYSGSSNVCTSPNFISSNPSCSATAPAGWAGQTKIIYCRIQDNTGAATSERSVKINITSSGGGNTTNTTKPVLASVTPNPSTVQQGQSVTFNSIGSSSKGNVKLVCGSASSGNDICNGAYASSNPSCTRQITTAWPAKTYPTYCRLIDATNAISNEIQTSFSVTTAGGGSGPTFTALSANPSTVRAGSNVTFTSTGSSTGHKVRLQCGLTSGYYKVCTSGYVDLNPSCSARAPTTWIGQTKTVYCRIQDDANAVTSDIAVQVAITSV